MCIRRLLVTPRVFPKADSSRRSSQRRRILWSQPFRALSGLFSDISAPSPLSRQRAATAEDSTKRARLATTPAPWAATARCRFLVRPGGSHKFDFIPRPSQFILILGPFLQEPRENTPYCSSFLETKKNLFRLRRDSQQSPNPIPLAALCEPSFDFLAACEDFSGLGSDLTLDIVAPPRCGLCAFNFSLQSKIKL